MAGIRLSIPQAPLHCTNCGRPLSGRMDSPFWPWDTPTLTPFKGGPHRWVCSLCCETEQCPEWKPLDRNLPEGSKSNLAKYVALDTN